MGAWGLDKLPKSVIICYLVSNWSNLDLIKLNKDSNFPGITMIGTAETMNLGMKMGLDAKLLAGILNSSSGRCWSSEVYNPVPGVMENVPASNGYNGGFG